MSKKFAVVSVFVVVIYILSVKGQGQENAFFRKDYAYLPNVKGFYKMHINPKNWTEAKTHCESEGARLFYPVDQDEATAVLRDYWNQTYPLRAWSWIAIADIFVRGVFETDDGIPVNDVYNKWNHGEPYNYNVIANCVIMNPKGEMATQRCEREFSYLCKKSLSSLKWNVLCDIPDSSYLYSNSLGKCYKFHKQLLTWSDAHAVCSAEQSYLAVINSQAEANEVVKVTADTFGRSNSKKLSNNVLLGFHKKMSNQWRTIKGTTLERSGYMKWSNSRNEGAGDAPCGSMLFNGLLDEVSCDAKNYFICEHDITSLGTSFDDRIKPNK